MLRLIRDQCRRGTKANQHSFHFYGIISFINFRLKLGQIIGLYFRFYCFLLCLVFVCVFVCECTSGRVCPLCSAHTGPSEVLKSGSSELETLSRQWLPNRVEGSQTSAWVLISPLAVPWECWGCFLYNLEGQDVCWRTREQQRRQSVGFW